jgi:hypothetical protein
MNPEFRRNLWLELTPTRLGVMLFALLAVLALAYLAGGDSRTTVGSIARLSFFVLVILWGGRLAADSVVQEINERTWDAQRMSALGPWSMSWGKLFGAPSAAWIGGLVALGVMMLSLGGGTLIVVAQLILVGVLCHATALTMSLQSIRKGRQPGRVKTFFFQLVGLASAGIAYFPSYTTWLFGNRFGEIRWYGFALPAFEFALATLAVFTVWAVVAVYRLMRLELQKPSTPIVWTAFLLFFVFYQAGFLLNGLVPLAGISREFSRTVQQQGPTIAALFAFVLLGALCYVAIFTEPKSPVAMGQFGAALRDRQWRRAWALTPRWLITLILTLVALLVSLLLLRGQNVDIDVLTVGSGVLISAFFFTVRNLAIALWFNYLPGAQRGDLAAFVMIAVLSGVVPFIFIAAGATDLISLVFPWGSKSTGLLVAVPALVEAVVVCFMAWRAWRAGERLRLQAV